MTWLCFHWSAIVDDCIWCQLEPDDTATELVPEFDLIMGPRETMQEWLNDHIAELA